MNVLRILLLSNVRPSRAWKIAKRFMREIPGAEIAGIIQRPFQQLPLLEQLIVTGGSQDASCFPSALWRVNRWFHSMLDRLVDGILWCVHGCPRNLNAVSKFTVETLAENCSRIGCSFLLTANFNDASVVDFICKKDPSLVIVLGELPVTPELSRAAQCGAIRVCQTVLKNDTTEAKEGVQTRVEYFAKGSETALLIAAMAIPFQAYDGLLGLTLKTDLIADDLLVQTTASLRTGSLVQVSEEVTKWAQKIFSPYLSQLEQAPAEVGQGVPSPRCRSVWKLCVETLLLCSPWVIARNWYRRWRGQYPVLILSHHLLADRPHPMGISTETFWRLVRFLQKHYRIVRLSEAVELLRSRHVTVPTIVLTFDDGYADNFVSLRAVAEETGIWVTLFIATQLVETHREFEHDVEKGTRGFLPLTWDQIRYWSLRGAEIGSHTRTHLDCRSSDRTRLREEIFGSKSDLESRIEKPISFFAFPFGKPENISPESVDLAASAYGTFVSDFGGENLPDRVIRQEHLFRKSLYTDPWELELELQSVFDSVERTKGWLRVRRTQSTNAPGGISSVHLFAASRNRSSTSDSVQ
jgi:peptidoglycan/xylan/chitin deacetylase (PgdA/CDA1 family)